ncbi:MAG TPA: hypothetical protein VFY91_10950 [Microbacterium sp.]|nr:hypothetical protein [Microbacterium sp.]
MTHEPPAAEVTINEIAGRLEAQFPQCPAATVRDVVAEAYDELKDAKVRDFVEVLVEKQAKKRLKALASGSSPTP